MDGEWMDELRGLRILVVEDEYLMALEMRQMVAALGAAVVGPVGRLEPALQLAREEALDAAILDVRLDNQTTLPLTLVLAQREIPYLLVAGYDQRDLPNDFHPVAVLSKLVGPIKLRARQSSCAMRDPVESARFCTHKLASTQWCFNLAQLPRDRMIAIKTPTPCFCQRHSKDCGQAGNRGYRRYSHAQYPRRRERLGPFARRAPTSAPFPIEASRGCDAAGRRLPGSPTSRS